MALVVPGDALHNALYLPRVIGYKERKSQKRRFPFRRWSRKAFPMNNPDGKRAGARFTPMRILPLLLALLCAGCQFHSTPQPVPVAEASEEIDPDNYLARISRELEAQKFAGIVSAIDFHASDYPIRSKESHARFSDALLEDYIGHFETVGLLVRKNMIYPVAAYEEVGYEAEKAWCNRDIQQYIVEKRRGGTSPDGEAYYAAFEELATFFMKRDRKGCADLDREKLFQEQ